MIEGWSQITLGTILYPNSRESHGDNLLWGILTTCQPCRTPCRLFIYKLLFGPLGLHLLVWSKLGRSPPFWPMKALTLQWSWAFGLVFEGALRVWATYSWAVMFVEFFQILKIQWFITQNFMQAMTFIVDPQICQQ